MYVYFRRLPESQQRIIKTHLSYEMLPEGIKDKNAKIIYVNRNPRDAVVSFYNHFKVLEGFTGKLKRFPVSQMTICKIYTGKWYF